jgi:hypothetical protein
MMRREREAAGRLEGKFERVALLGVSIRVAEDLSEEFVDFDHRS